MLIDELKKLIENTNTFYQAVTLIQKYKPVPLSVNTNQHAFKSIPDILNQIDPKYHNIFDKAKRPDKIIVDGNGNSSTVPRARIAIPLQRKIVNSGAAFLCGNPIKLDYTAGNETEQTMADLITKIWDDNKLDYKSKTLAKILFAETEVAELWYTPLAEEGYWAETQIPEAELTLRMKIISNSRGDSLYPVFDPTGDMIAFGRGYRTSLAGDTQAGITYEDHFDIYTTDKTYYGIKQGTDWQVATSVQLLNKIPIIYYSQPYPDYYEVQEMIERFELLISNHADTNDYFGDPTIIVKGQIKSFAKKGETGKVLEIDETADVSYLTWTAAPESIKMEIDNLWKFIHTSTQTPDISFESVKAIGLGQISGIALKMLFIDAHLKASDKEEVFGEGIQRRINLIKSSLTKISNKLAAGTPVVIKPKFEYYLPRDNKEKIDVLNSAVMGGLMSKETAVMQNPLLENPEDEWALIQSEQPTPAEQLNQLMNTGNPGAKVLPIKKANG